MLNDMERLEKTLFRLEQGMIKIRFLHFLKMTLDSRVWPFYSLSHEMQAFGFYLVLCIIVQALVYFCITFLGLSVHK